MEQNNTNFPIEISKKYSQYKIPSHNKPAKKYPSKHEDIQLFSYQKFVEDYMSPSNNYRGLLLYFGLGSGKSISAINVAENANRKVIVMLPRSLRDNFIEEIITYIPEFNRPKNWKELNDEQRRKIQLELERKIIKKYSFISSNAGNSAEKLEKLDLKSQNFNEVSDNDLKDFATSFKTLDNSLLIIDEVHTLISNMVNPDAKNGTKILHMIMNAKNLKLLFLSGTPVVSNPFELGVLFNMLRGYLTISKELSKEKFTAFPENYDDFWKYFVDAKENKIKNKEIFQERIVGLVSYYQGSRNNDKRDIYPEKLKMRKINVRMSEYQWKVYVKQRRFELDEERKIKYSTKQFVKLVNKKPARSMATTFSVGTRQICNYALPEGIEKPKRKGVLELPDLNKVLMEIPKIALTVDLEKYSPKMKAILTHINEINGKSLVYSEFVSLEGIGIFSRILEENGFTNFEKIPEFSPNLKNKRFAIFSGNTSDSLRRKILDTFNAQNNLHGEYLRLILFTASGAQGLNTRGVRSVHIMEPYWNYNRIEQIIGRAVRTNSHIDLPFAERDVQPFVYMSIPPDNVNVDITLGEKLTTDQRIFQQAVQKQVLLDSFLEAIREMAVDCELNHEHNKETVKECRICVPNNKKMFPLQVENHLLPGGRNCYSEKKAVKGKLKDITIDGRKLKEDTDGKLYEEVAGQKGVYIEIKI
jgi:superfamily II DNA or RNA helicase